eukprot:gene457-50373_t
MPDLDLGRNASGRGGNLGNGVENAAMQQPAAWKADPKTKSKASDPDPLLHTSAALRRLCGWTGGVDGKKDARADALFPPSATKQMKFDEWAKPLPKVYPASQKEMKDVMARFLSAAGMSETAYDLPEGKALLTTSALGKLVV